MYSNNFFTIGDVLKLRVGVGLEFYVIGIIPSPTRVRGEYFYRLISLNAQSNGARYVFHERDLKILRKSHLGELAQIKPIVEELGEQRATDEINKLIKLQSSSHG